MYVYISTYIDTYMFVYIYIHIYVGFIRMIYCGPSNPTDYDHKIQESSNCSVLKTECLKWSPIYSRIVKKWPLQPLKERTGLAG